MNDINFFSSFEKLKKDQKKKTRTTWGVILGVILAVVLFYGFLGFRILYLNREIQKGQAYLNSPDVKTKLTQLRVKREATQNLRQYDNEIGKALQKIARADQVSSEFMDTLQKAFPSTIRLKYLNMKGTQISLQGNAPNLTSTAELTHNLDASGLFSRVQVSSISKDKDGVTYFFVILCDLKEVAAK